MAQTLRRSVNLPPVTIDTNVLISTVLERDVEQQQKTEQLLLGAENGELLMALPQFVIFEAIYVLRSVYKLAPHEITTMIREAISLPGMTIVDGCPWPLFFEHWSNLRPAVIDAAILALAIANRYTLATFDHKLSNRAKSFGVAPYW